MAKLSISTQNEKSTAVFSEGFVISYIIHQDLMVFKI